MTETTRDEVNQLIDAFAKVSVLYLQSQLNDFRREQSETNQRLERALQVVTADSDRLRDTIKELEKEIGWLKISIGKLDGRIDSAGRYVKQVLAAGNGKHEKFSADA